MPYCGFGCEDFEDGSNAAGRTFPPGPRAQGKFAFSCKVPPGIDISIGQNDHPWMATGGKEVFEGTENPGAGLRS